MIFHLSLFDCLFLWSVHNFTTTVITTKYKIERKQPWSLFFWSFSINYRVRMELLLASMNDCVALFVAWERSLIETGCFFIFAIVPKVVVTAIFSHYFVCCLFSLILEHGNTSTWFILTRLFVDWPFLFTNLSPSFCFHIQILPFLFILLLLFQISIFPFGNDWECLLLLCSISFLLLLVVSLYQKSFRLTLSIRSPFGWLFLSEVPSVDSFCQKSSRLLLFLFGFSSGIVNSFIFRFKRLFRETQVKSWIHSFFLFS